MEPGGAEPIRSICVFCGASRGHDPRYVATAAAVGERLANGGIQLVYGGGRLGLMGTLADAALAAGGRVVGVIPRGLVDRELAHPDVTELRIVDSLHERKAVMADLADGFIALPGGLGTLEELAEVLSWAQLDLHTMLIEEGFAVLPATRGESGYALARSEEPDGHHGRCPVAIAPQRRMTPSF